MIPDFIMDMEGRKTQCGSAKDFEVVGIWICCVTTYNFGDHWVDHMSNQNFGLRTHGFQKVVELKTIPKYVFEQF